MRVSPWTGKSPRHPRGGGAAWADPKNGDIPGEGCVLVADSARRLVWTNCLAPEFAPATLGTGPHDFGFTVDIVFEAVNGGCAYRVTVRHATPEDAKTHENMGFYDGWGTCAEQLDALAVTPKQQANAERK